MQLSSVHIIKSYDLAVFLEAGLKICGFVKLDLTESCLVIMLVPPPTLAEFESILQQ